MSRNPKLQAAANRIARRMIRLGVYDFDQAFAMLQRLVKKYPRLAPK